MTKPIVGDRVAKRIQRVNQDLQVQYDRAFDRVYKLLFSDLRFGAEYAELAASDIADDYMNGLLEGEPPEVPLWHEPDDDGEEEEGEEEEEEDETEDETSDETEAP